MINGEGPMYFQLLYLLVPVRYPIVSAYDTMHVIPVNLCIGIIYA